jgi:hypothetical protein
MLAVDTFQQMSLKQGLVITDCKQLADAFASKQPPYFLDWRLYSTTIQIWLFFRMNPGFTCVFLGRDRVVNAHKLANWARIGKHEISYNMFPLPVMN